MTESYLIPVKKTIDIAWLKVSGTKRSFWAAIVIFIGIMIVFGFIDVILKMFLPPIQPFFSFITQIVSFLLQMGIVYIGIERASELPISYRLIFYPFEGRVAIRIILLLLLQTVILMIPLAVMIIPIVNLQQGNDAMFIPVIIISVVSISVIIYLGIRMMFAVAYVLDEVVNPWKAIKLSFGITKNNFWRLSIILGLQSLIVFISVLPVGLGLIWTLPLAYILYGEMYKNLNLNNRDFVRTNVV